MSCDLVVVEVCGEKVGAGDETKPLYERGTDLYMVLLLLIDFNTSDLIVVNRSAVILVDGRIL